MGLSIGLEALTKTTIVKPIINLDVAYADFMESYTNVIDQLNYGRQLFVAYENLCSIQKTVKQYGFTKSLEALIGHQLGTNSAQVSTEAEEAKTGVWAKIIKWFKDMGTYIKDFFAKLINTRRGIKLKLNDVIKNANTLTVKAGVSNFKGISDFNAVHTNIVKLASSGTTLEASELEDIAISDDKIATTARNHIKAIDDISVAEKASIVTLKAALDNLKKNKDASANEISEAKTNTAAAIKQITSLVKNVITSSVNFMKVLKSKKKEKAAKTA